MEERGIVKTVSRERATVAIERATACSECKSGGSCDLVDDESTIEAINLANAAVGQRVVIDMQGFSYIKGTMFVYGLPALALLAGAIIGKYIRFSFLPALGGEVLSATMGFFFLLVTLIIVKFVSARSEKKVEHTPIIIKIIEGG